MFLFTLFLFILVCMCVVCIHGPHTLVRRSWFLPVKLCPIQHQGQCGLQRDPDIHTDKRRETALCEVLRAPHLEHSGGYTDLEADRGKLLMVLCCVDMVVVIGQY